MFQGLFIITPLLFSFLIQSKYKVKLLIFLTILVLVSKGYSFIDTTILGEMEL